MENKTPEKDSKQCCSVEKKCCCSSPRCALLFSGLIFGLVALLHLYRLIDFFPVNIGSISVPYGASIVAFIIFGLLSLWMFCSSKKVSS